MICKYCDLPYECMWYGDVCSLTCSSLLYAYERGRKQGREEERNRIADALEKDADSYRSTMAGPECDQAYVLRFWAHRLRKGEV